jgi:hypothetical protein
LKTFDLAEPIPGPRTDALSKAAASAGVVVVASLFEERMPGMCHNTAVVFDSDGKMLGLYRKMHIPHDPLFFEKYYFRPGDVGFKVFDTQYGKVGTLVCWDQWFPEGARLTALKGAELLVYPTAIGWHPREKAEFGKAQHDARHPRSHAMPMDFCGGGIESVRALSKCGRPRVLGGIVRCRSVWHRACVCVACGRRIAGRAMLAIADAGCAPQLAVLPRSQDRCVCRNDASLGLIILEVFNKKREPDSLHDG